MNKERSIATAFKDWVDRTKEKLKSSESSQKLDEKRVKAILDDAFSETRKGFIQGMGPAVYHSFLEGAVEAGYGMDPDALTNLAYNYAAQVADYANSMSSEAAAEAYIGALKRKQQPKQAFDFMRRSFGTDRRAVKSLLKQLENSEIKDYTIRQKPDQKRKNMDAYIAATVQRRGRCSGMRNRSRPSRCPWPLCGTLRLPRGIWTRVLASSGTPSGMRGHASLAAQCTSRP